jgi:hypothetical protein
MPQRFQTWNEINHLERGDMRKESDLGISTQTSKFFDISDVFWDAEIRGKGRIICMK